MIKKILEKLGLTFLKDKYKSEELLRVRVNELSSLLDNCLRNNNSLNKSNIERNKQIEELEAKIFYLENKLKKDPFKNSNDDISSITSLIIDNMRTKDKYIEFYKQKECNGE